MGICREGSQGQTWRPEEEERGEVEKKEGEGEEIKEQEDDDDVMKVPVVSVYVGG